MEADCRPNRDSDERSALPDSVVLSGSKTGRHRAAILLAVSALAVIIAFRIYEDFYDERALHVFARAREASRATSRLLATVLDAETGQRAYLLTKSDSYLTRFQNAVNAMPEVLEQFRAATESLPIDKTHEVRAARLAQAKIAELKRIVDEVRSGREADALVLVNSGTGARLMQELRNVATALEQSYDRYAAAAQSSSEFRRQLSLIATATGILVAGVILVLAGIRLSRSSAEQYQLLVRIADREQQLQRLADRLQVIREEERAHLAREMHDVLGQSLTGIKLDLSAAARRLESGEPGVTVRKLREGSAAVDETIRLMRKIATELRPALLDHIGLAAAIKAHAEDVKDRTGLDLILNMSDDKIGIDADQRIALYRIYQECLTNVARHASATRVWVTLACDQGRLLLQVKDDGKGFDARNAAHSLGLLGMQERARLAGGDFCVSSQPGKGTTVEVRLAVRSRCGEERS
jgi:signal transduction histidine kinase